MNNRHFPYVEDMPRRRRMLRQPNFAMLPLRRPMLHQPNSASPLILPDELIVEIISWLPVKTLMKFRCVNKFFETTISDAHFVQMHLNKSSRNLHVAQLWRPDLLWQPCLLNNENASLVTLSIPELLQNKITILHDSLSYQSLNDYLNEGKVVGSCNGLICFISYSYPRYSDRLRLWNPATRTKSKRFTFTIPFHYYYGLKYSFGYDNSAGTYKVVAFCVERGCTKNVVKVFTLGDNSWRDIQCFPALPLYFDDPDKINGVYLSGTINWLALRDYDYEFDSFKSVTVEQFVIVSLDLSTETYTMMLLPRGFVEVPRRNVPPTVVVMTNCLCFGHDFKKSHFVIWQMKDFGVQESWVQLFKISYHRFGSSVFCSEFQLSKFLPLYLSKNGQTFIFAIYDEGPAFVYNCIDNEIEQIRTSNKISSLWVQNYIESLVPTR